jgi:thiol-disulfide isomerase/thioredoxin
LFDQTGRAIVYEMLFRRTYSKVSCASVGLMLCLTLAIGAQESGVSGSARPPAPGTQKVVTVKQIDLGGLRKALTPSSKPLLVNFWATWCDPCREEFPDLVRLDAEYKGKIDFITISLDELSEINRDVPKFLTEMNAPMPAYLLKAVDDDAAITFVSKEWAGALPLTILYDPAGKQMYYRQGKVKLETVRAEIDKLLKPAK